MIGILILIMMMWFIQYEHTWVLPYEDDGDVTKQTLTIIMMMKLERLCDIVIMMMTKVDSMCKMDLRKFPMDTQECEVLNCIHHHNQPYGATSVLDGIFFHCHKKVPIGSFGYNAGEISYTWAESQVQMFTKILLQDIASSVSLNWQFYLCPKNLRWWLRSLLWQTMFLSTGLAANILSETSLWHH